MSSKPTLNRTEVVGLVILSLAVISGLWYLALLSPGVEGGMDSYEHYFIARYSWKYPSKLLLDQWGKPIYNILASPFAQLGMMGVEVLNIGLFVGSAWLTWLTARALRFKYAWLAFLLALASPIFFDNVISGLTEPMCAFILMLAVWLFATERLMLGALVMGFLPYARSEGYVLMAVAGFYLLFIRGNWKAFLMLFAGSLVMNSIGWLVEGDPYWIYTSNPYIKFQRESMMKQENICGHGSWDHYLNALKWVMGKPRMILFFTGIILLFMTYVRNFRDRSHQTLFWIVLGMYALYFAVHSWIWQAGLMGSCGYERVLVVIDPLAALLMAFVLELMLRFVGSILPGRWKTLVVTLTLVATLGALYIPWKIYGHKYPIDISEEQKLFSEAATWYNESSYQDRKIYFLYPYFNMLTDIDPYDDAHFTKLWSFDIQYAPEGCIVIWDGHFGPNEGNVPLELLEKHHDFRKIKSFYPDKPFKTLNDYDFEIHVFERVRVTP
ncbi:MAG: hypothetical protein H6608_10200 [Flavobacteriales bacterium]|nr:hypothetical protein [Flavobacteriales bacterium]